MVPCGPFFFSSFFAPQSHPTDSSTSVIGHIHLIQAHQGRRCSGFAVHQEKWSWFTEEARCSEHKRTMDPQQMQLCKKKQHKKTGQSEHHADLHTRRTIVCFNKYRDGVGGWGGHANARLAVIITLVWVERLKVGLEERALKLALWGERGRGGGAVRL